MVDHDAIASKIQSHVEEARERINSVDEGHKRWNRAEEAMEAVAEGAIELLDEIGRYDEANDIQSHMAAHERFDLLLEMFDQQGEAISSESDAAGLLDDFVFHRDLLKAMNDAVAGERKHRPGG